MFVLASVVSRGLRFFLFAWLIWRYGAPVSYTHLKPVADEKIIFSMVGVSKTFTNQKKVLNNIYLSFFYGAKIGIIGLNGSGKSTLMKIIAGLEKNFQGEVVFSPGYTVGYLEQEPQLDDTKTVREVVEEGCAEVVALLKEYEEVNAKFMEPMDDDQMAKLIERQGAVSYTHLISFSITDTGSNPFSRS